MTETCFLSERTATVDANSLGGRKPPGKQGPLIKIDKQGNWFYQDLPIINKAIFLFFNQHLAKDPEQGYYLKINQEICQVLVEDTPYVITDVTLIAKPPPRESYFNIRLNDETEEQLNLESLCVGKDNVLYCEVKGGKFSARFLRPSYYHLTKYVQQEGQDSFYIPLNGRKFYL